MLLEARLKLSAEVLGNVHHHGRRVFHRPQPDLISMKQDMWAWSFKQTFEHLMIKAEPSTVRVASCILAPKTHTLVRIIGSTAEARRAGGANVRPKEDKFEAIGEGAVLTINFLLVPNGPGQINHVVSLKDFGDSLAFIGQFIGMSHWGNDLNYGRFHVQEVKETHEFFHTRYRTSPTGADGSEPAGDPTGARAG